MRKRNDDVSDLSDFAELVAGMVCSDDFEEYADEFAEMACRKLWRLGYIAKDGEDWKRREEECEDENENWYTELDDPKIAERRNYETD